ncbi:hypothetical protein JCM10908_001203 [Rhodotorula pacifica]|uniref:Nur1/Mug154 family protein n=1 Tax=Rhodotorula pacifica TaxID=1495444 RepID=UPI00317E9143
MYATPDQPRTARRAVPAAGSPFTSTPTSAGNGHSANASRRALGQQLARAPGTPVGRLLKSEGVATASPRRIRQRSWTTKLRDWPSNALLSLETSFQLLSFDAAGYPLGAALNALHLLVRLPSFYAALPAISDLWSSSSTSASPYWSEGASRYARKAATADARLEALQRQAGGNRAGGWSNSTWWFSLALILLSIANSAYLVTRRRKYQMVLRRDPLSSPNAKSAMLNFSRAQATTATRSERLRRKALEWIGWSKPEKAAAYPVQELNVWVPDHALWSLRLFTLYSPPIAIMYHLLSPSNFLALLICGALFTAQTFVVVYLYSTLVSDRAALQAEVMHEYNAKFVHPRVFVPKRDACVSTSEAEMVSTQEWRQSSSSAAAVRKGTAGRWSTDAVGSPRLGSAERDYSDHGEEVEEEEVVQRGSGRKVRRRQSEMPLRRAVLERQDSGEERLDGSPMSGRKKARASMYG